MRIAASMTYCSIVWIHEICKNNGFSRPIFTVMAIFTGFLSIFPTVSPDYDQSIDIQNNTNSVSMRGVSPGALRFVSFCCIMHWARNNHCHEVGSVWYSLWLLEYFEVFSPSIWSYFFNKYFWKQIINLKVSKSTNSNENNRKVSSFMWRKHCLYRFIIIYPSWHSNR